jgi:uncharacterized membrane protein
MLWWEDVFKPLLVGLAGLAAVILLFAVVFAVVWMVGDPGGYWAVMGGWGWWFVGPFGAAVLFGIWCLGFYILDTLS